ncbi:MAG: Hpt domain-containing protein [Deltaproteobacteria bacterium]|nr:Hpt domain-containing protein [Deltaproteobacteria bacterium]
MLTELAVFMEDMDLEILVEFVSEVRDDMADLDERFIKLEEEPDNKENIDSIFRTVHSVKGNSGFFGLNAIKVMAHKIENLLDDLRQGKRFVTKETVTVLLEGIDYLKAMFAALAEDPKPKELLPEEQDYLDRLEAFLQQGETKGKVVEEILSAISPIVLDLKTDPNFAGNPKFQELQEKIETYQSRLVNEKSSDSKGCGKQKIEREQRA